MPIHCANTKHALDLLLILLVRFVIFLFILLLLLLLLLLLSPLFLFLPCAVALLRFDPNKGRNKL